MLETKPASPPLDPSLRPAPWRPHADLPETDGQRGFPRAVRAKLTITEALRQKSSSSLLSLSDVDAEIAAAVSGAPEARRALVARAFALAPGDVELAQIDITETTFALMVLSGTLQQRTSVAGASMTDFLSVGDVLTPFSATPGEADGVEVRASDQVLVAALDQRFLRAAARWPQLMIIVQRRICEQRHRLAVQGAIGQLPQVDQRLLAIMRHLADRDGTVTPEGIVLPYRFSHQALAELVGARRPTVSLALKRLRERGELMRNRTGEWLLVHPG